MRVRRLANATSILAAGALLLLQPHCLCAQSPFGYFEQFDSDSDAYTPTDTEMINDPNLDGLPPDGAENPGPLLDWEDLRTVGGSGIVEEVSDGFAGVSASDGQGHFGLVQFEADGPLTRIARSQTYPNRFSFRADIYADPALPANNGEVTAPDFIWRASVLAANGFGNLADSAITAAVQMEGPNKVWEFNARGSNLPGVLVPVGHWYTMEIIVENNTTASGAATTGQLQFTHKIWLSSHAGMPIFERTTIPPLGPYEISEVGGAFLSQFTEPEVPYIYIDRVGVGRAIGYSDLNGDGAVNNLDIQPFEKALANPAVYSAQFALDDYVERGDINLDGAFNNLDIQPFERHLTGNFTPSLTSSVTAVPEPSSLALLILAAIGLIAQSGRGRASAAETVIPRRIVVPQLGFATATKLFCGNMCSQAIERAMRSNHLRCRTTQ